MAKLFDPGAGRQRVDRYELVGELASGGMATVFLARLSGVGGFQRFVAMKRLHPHLANEKEFVEMFLDEARIAARIHHPNVVPILEVGASPVGYYLVMEYIEGDTLARLLARAAQRGKRLPIPIALRIAVDTLSGLHAAHELRDDAGNPINLVHRDVSPQNVLVGVDGIARITDFGVARAASRLTATRVGQLKGKIAYMAPEQAAGEESLDRRADVFAAGIVIWEELAAKRLFKAENEAATLSRVMTEPVPLLSELVPGLSVQLSNVVMRALERDVNKRFSTCAQFGDALEAAATGKERIATPRELAAYVTEVLGEEVSAQREAVRAWIARSEPSQVGPLPSTTPSSSVSAAAMSLSELDGTRTATQSQNMPTPRRSRAGLFVFLILLLVAVGGGGFLYARETEQNHSVSAASQPPLASPPPIPSPAPAATDSAAPAPVGVDPSSVPIEAPATPKPVVLQQRPRAAAKPADPDSPSKKPKKKSDEDVDLRNPYR
ncbi:MAG TPA: serine/threonine-protein kinase [Polyangiaceae bacterium]|nr:serine/threonine-protein kinase [Polyangiaceae bacterium]